MRLLQLLSYVPHGLSCTKWVRLDERQSGRGIQRDKACEQDDGVDGYHGWNCSTRPGNDEESEFGIHRRFRETLRRYWRTRKGMYAAYSQIKCDVRMERLMTDKMLRIEEVMEITRLSRATIYRKMSKGQFPKPLKLGDRAVRWRQSEIEAWLASLPRAMG